MEPNFGRVRPTVRNLTANQVLNRGLQQQLLAFVHDNRQVFTLEGVAQQLIHPQLYVVLPVSGGVWTTPTVYSTIYSWHDSDWSCWFKSSFKRWTLAILRNNLLKAQKKVKDQVDIDQRDLEFQVGDWVYLKLQFYRQTSIATRQHQTSSTSYLGSYEVLERICQVAYKIDLPQTSKIHQVFHVSLLKPHKGEPLNLSGPPPTQAI